MFDKNKPIIALTGATGFLGSHLMASMHPIIDTRYTV
jgi:nucleoside-diphosphate-sugar epimerase